MQKREKGKLIPQFHNENVYFDFQNHSLSPYQLLVLPFTNHMNVETIVYQLIIVYRKRVY